MDFYKSQQTHLEIEAGAESIIPLALIREYVGIDDDLDAETSATLKNIRQAVIEDGEHNTGLIWAPAEYVVEVTGTRWRSDGLAVPFAPVFGVVEIKTVDAAGAEVIIPASDIALSPSRFDSGSYQPWPALVLKSGIPDRAQSFIIRLQAGWDGDYFPGALRMWALVRIATLFDCRYDIARAGATKMPREHIDRALDRYRVTWI